VEAVSGKDFLMDSGSDFEVDTVSGLDFEKKIVSSSDFQLRAVSGPNFEKKMTPCPNFHVEPISGPEISTDQVSGPDVSKDVSVDELLTIEQMDNFIFENENRKNAFENNPTNSGSKETVNFSFYKVLKCNICTLKYIKEEDKDHTCSACDFWPGKDYSCNYCPEVFANFRTLLAHHKRGQHRRDNESTISFSEEDGEEVVEEIKLVTLQPSEEPPAVTAPNIKLIRCLFCQAQVPML
jgi:hypothetical protein